MSFYPSFLQAFCCTEEVNTAATLKKVGSQSQFLAGLWELEFQGLPTTPQTEKSGSLCLNCFHNNMVDAKPTLFGSLEF